MEGTPAAICLPQPPPSTSAPPASHHAAATTKPEGSSASLHSSPALGLAEKHYVAGILAELEQERRRSAELLSRLAALEARVGAEERGGAGEQMRQVCSQYPTLKGLKKVKGQGKTGKTGNCETTESTELCLADIEVKQEQGSQNEMLDLRESCSRQDVTVTWMACEDMLHLDSDKAMRRVADSGEEEYLQTDDSDDDNSDDNGDNSFSTPNDEYKHEDEEVANQTRTSRLRKIKRCNEGSSSLGFQLGGDDGLKNKRIMDVNYQDGCILSPGIIDGENYENKDIAERRLKKKRKSEGEKSKLEHIHHGKTDPGYEMFCKPSGMLNSYKNAHKTAFCPMEVKRIMESGVLALKNAQSHTMRKIIVFSSLCIRHGCEDLYELDFSHFSILRRGEPYLSAKDPGEHVLYEQHGCRRRMFYPNRKNPILCPVHILDEERAMRPSSPSCPSCLFLCIKYGGRTRNLPQNEYVRQRMGRNKLKSFGPLMCQMASLVQIRTGSFFFKALGITLLFMAGFPEDLIRRETKYHNLELLHKYYRSDSDTKVDQLFHPYPSFYTQDPLATSTKAPPGNKSSRKKTLRKNSGSQSGSLLSPIAAQPVSASSFRGLSFPGPTITPLPSCPFLPHFPISSSCRLVTPTMSISSSVPTTAILGTSVQHFPHPPYGMFPPYGIQRPSAGGVPMPLWAPVNSLPPSHFPSQFYGYQPFSATAQYVSSPAYYAPPIFPILSSIERESEKKDNDAKDSDSDSDSSSSGVDEKSERENTSDSKST